MLGCFCCSISCRLAVHAMSRVTYNCYRRVTLRVRKVATANVNRCPNGKYMRVLFAAELSIKETKAIFLLLIAQRAVFEVERNCPFQPNLFPIQNYSVSVDFRNAGSSIAVNFRLAIFACRVNRSQGKIA